MKTEETYITCSWPGLKTRLTDSLWPLEHGSGGGDVMGWDGIEHDGKGRDMMG